MRALVLAGRPAEALEAFAELRAMLRSELGVEPGPAVRRLHEAILKGEDLAPEPDRALRAAQLPGDVRGFAGRSAQIAQLDGLLRSAGGRLTTVVISGIAGVGKTALAVHWAHRAADGFPDGNLYVDLRGFDPAGPPLSPDEAIGELIDALGARDVRMPASLAAKTGLLRTLLAGRRVLLVLDNARSTEQVRPLLLASGGSMTLVTSRVTMAGLIASEGATRYRWTW